MRVARDLMLRPFVAAIAVAVIVVLPILALGEASDAEARAHGRAEMLEAGSGVADRAVLRIEQYLTNLRKDLTAIAAADLRVAIVAGDRAGILAGVVRAGAVTLDPTGPGTQATRRQSIARSPVTRVAVTDASGAIIAGLDRNGLVACFSGGGLTLAGSACVDALGSVGGRRDARAIELLAATATESRSRLSDPYLMDSDGGRRSAVAVGALITRDDAGLRPLGLLIVEIDVEGSLSTLDLLDGADDAYVIDHRGRALFSARGRGQIEAGADLTASPLVAKAVRQPVIGAVSGPLTLREEGLDPFTGAIRPFATSVMTMTQGTRGSGGDAYGWQVLVVPDQTPLRTVEAALMQLRLARLGLGSVLLVGAFLLASAVRVVTRQRSELARALGRQTATSEVLDVISRSPGDVTPVLQAVIDRAVRLTHADNGSLMRQQADDMWDQVVVAGTFVDERSYLTANHRIGPDRSTITGRVLLELRSVQTPDQWTDPEYDRTRLVAAEGIRTILGVPLLRDQRVIGVILLRRRLEAPFSAVEIGLVETFAAQAVIAIENVRLFSETQRKSQELEAASRHKSEFLANMSHELRTPLNAVIGFAEVLEQGMAGPVTERQQEYVRDIASSGKHLLDLVNEILDLSKVEAGRMELEPSEFALADTIHAALAFVRERAAKHGIDLAAEVPPDLGIVTADERKVRQVLLNLLSNAVKFTPDGGWIGVSARRQEGELTVSVRDTGIGIAPADQPTVFEEFRQVGKASDRSREGTGLGLTLAKRFIELHGGRIWLESELGKGSTFTFALPVRQTARAEA